MQVHWHIPFQNWKHSFQLVNTTVAASKLQLNFQIYSGIYTDI